MKSSKAFSIYVLGMMFVFAAVLLSGCQGGSYPYEVNIKVTEKGVATADSTPFPKWKSGTLWVRTTKGLIRFREAKMWEDIQVGKFYALIPDPEAYAIYMAPSAVDTEYVISGQEGIWTIQSNR